MSRTSAKQQTRCAFATFPNMSAWTATASPQAAFAQAILQDSSCGAATDLQPSGFDRPVKTKIQISASDRNILLNLYLMLPTFVRQPRIVQQSDVTARSPTHAFVPTSVRRQKTSCLNWRLKKKFAFRHLPRSRRTLARWKALQTDKTSPLPFGIYHVPDSRRCKMKYIGEDRLHCLSAFTPFPTD